MRRYAPLILAIRPSLIDHNELGMYSRSDWGGPIEPFILTTFPNQTVEGDDDPIVSLVIFEWKDQDLIGVPSNPDDDTSPVRSSMRVLETRLIRKLESVNLRRREY